jgi:O-antigen/teichoic acid export membrane protein
MLDRKFKSDTIFAYATQAGTVAVGFVFMLAITRYGSVELYGALMLLVSLSSVLGNAASFRTNESVVAFYKQGEVAGDLARCKFAIYAGILLDILVGSILLAILYLNDRLIASSLLKDAGAEREVALYGWVILVSALKSTPQGFLLATDRIKVVNAINFIEQLSKLIIAVSLVFFRGYLTLKTVIVAALIPAICAVLITYIPLAVALLTHLRTAPFRVERTLTGDYARFSLSTFTSSALKAGNQNIDTLILGFATDPRIAGIYATFRQFLSPLAFMTVPFESIMYPRFVKAVVEGRRTEIHKAIFSINRKLVRPYGLALIAAIPAILLYDLYIKINLGIMNFLALGIMGATAILRGRLWWSRAFSNSTNPRISMISNAGATLYVLVVLFPASHWLGMTGTASSMFVLAVVLTSYWFSELKKFVFANLPSRVSERAI